MQLLPRPKVGMLTLRENHEVLGKRRNLDELTSNRRQAEGGAPDSRSHQQQG